MPIFFASRGSGCRWSRAFPIFDKLIRSGDIRDQSRKLSKIANYFGRFFGRRKFLGAGIVKIVPNFSPLPRGVSTEKSPVRILPLSRKLLSLTRQIFNFHDKIFLGGPPSQLGCALGSLRQPLARIISWRSTP